MDIGIANQLSYSAVNESKFKKIDAYQRFSYIEVPLFLSKGYYYRGVNLYIKGGITAGVLVQNLLDLKGSNIHMQGTTKGVDHYSASAVTSI